MVDNFGFKYFEIKNDYSKFERDITVNWLDGQKDLIEFLNENYDSRRRIDNLIHDIIFEEEYLMRRIHK